MIIVNNGSMIIVNYGTARWLIVVNISYWYLNPFVFAMFSMGISGS